MLGRPARALLEVSSTTPKDTDENYLAVCQARETGENGLRLDAVGNFISSTVLRVPSVVRRVGRP